MWFGVFCCTARAALARRGPLPDPHGAALRGALPLSARANARPPALGAHRYIHVLNTCGTRCLFWRRSNASEVHQTEYEDEDVLVVHVRCRCGSARRADTGLPGPVCAHTARHVPRGVPRLAPAVHCTQLPAVSRRPLLRALRRYVSTVVHSTVAMISFCADLCKGIRGRLEQYRQWSVDSMLAALEGTAAAGSALDEAAGPRVQLAAAELDAALQPPVIVPPVEREAGTQTESALGGRASALQRASAELAGGFLTGVGAGSIANTVQVCFG